MPLTPTQLATGIGTSTATSGSFIPVASEWIFAIAAHARGGAAAAQSTINDTESGVWTFIGGVNQGSSNAARCDIHAKLAVPSPVSITVSSNSAVASRGLITICQIIGADSDFANVATGVNASGDPATTLGVTQLATSTTLIGFSGFGAAAVTMPGAYTGLASFTTTNLISESGYAIGTTTPTASWVSTNTNSSAIMLEIKAAATPSYPIWLSRSPAITHMLAR